MNEADRQVVRAELEAVEDITFGLGLLARMHRGSTITFRRTLVNNEIWLPAEAQYKLVGKTLIFRKFALESTTQFSDYRKFNVTHERGRRRPPRSSEPGSISNASSTISNSNRASLTCGAGPAASRARRA